MAYTTPHFGKPESPESTPFDLNSLIYGSNPVATSVAAIPEFQSIPLSQLKFLRDRWLESGRRSQHSKRTLEEKRNYSDKLFWFLEHKRYDACGLVELEAFFDYCTTGHDEPGGRWGAWAEREDKRALAPMRPVTLKTYFVYLKGFWTWMVERKYITATPFPELDVPEVSTDQITPFTPEQVHALMAAAKRSRQPKRDQAIILFLLDTGVRASELCELRFRNVDFSDEETLRFTFFGKGDKRRTVRLGKKATSAMWKYFKEEHGLEKYSRARGGEFDTKKRRIERRKIDLMTPVFLSAHRAAGGDPLTRYGLLGLIRKMGKEAGVGGVRCSPHTFRHTFAITFLRRGGDIFTLQEMLGHSSLNTVQIYLKVAQADVDNQHRKFSPADGVMG